MQLFLSFLSAFYLPFIKNEVFHYEFSITDLDTFTEEIRNVKLHSLCSVVHGSVRL